MNSRKIQLIVVALGVVGLSLGMIDMPAQAQSAPYYAAQLGGGSVAALAGGLAGTLAGGLSGGLLGVIIEFLRDPAAIYQETTEWPPESLAMRWSSRGAKSGFSLGVAVGAAMGVIAVGAAFEVAGDPQGAMLGALTGSLVGMVLLLDASRPLFKWQFIRTDREIQAHTRGGVTFRLIVNPVTLAALGATIGYNWQGIKSPRHQAISIALFAGRF